MNSRQKINNLDDIYLQGSSWIRSDLKPIYDWEIYGDNQITVQQLSFESTQQLL